MQIRRATMEDAMAVLDWRNDPQTIAVSKTGSVDRASHLAWFAKAIESPDRMLLIASEDGRRLGMVRFDRSGDTWLVSINMAPDVRGQGYGTRALRKSLSMIGAVRLLAEIKPENIASIRTFERCGFQRVGDEGGLGKWVRDGQ
jgi:RimJ/RimL family protein N-acetyltransferase